MVHRSTEKIFKTSKQNAPTQLSLQPRDISLGDGSLWSDTPHLCPGPLQWSFICSSDFHNHVTQCAQWSWTSFVNRIQIIESFVGIWGRECITIKCSNCLYNPPHFGNRAMQCTVVPSLGALQRVSSTSIVGVIRLIPALCHRAPSTTHPGNKQIMNRVPTRVDNHPISGLHLPPSLMKVDRDEDWSTLFEIHLSVVHFLIMNNPNLYWLGGVRRASMVFLTFQFQAICHLLWKETIYLSSSWLWWIIW